jgi:hypothetical protein
MRRGKYKTKKSNEAKQYSKLMPISEDEVGTFQIETSRTDLFTFHGSAKSMDDNQQTGTAYITTNSSNVLQANQFAEIQAQVCHIYSPRLDTVASMYAAESRETEGEE